jgi:hypothetical protein
MVFPKNRNFKGTSKCVMVSNICYVHVLAIVLKQRFVEGRKFNDQVFKWPPPQYANLDTYFQRLLQNSKETPEPNPV